MTERDASREPNNLAEALAIPVDERCRWILAQPMRADWTQPGEWPEIKAVAGALAEATGKPAHARLATYHRDAGVRAMVELYAAGWSQADLAKAVVFTSKSEWWTRDRANRGLSSFTPEVVRRACAAADGSPRPARAVRKVESRSLEEQGFVPPPDDLLAGLSLPPGSSGQDAVAAIMNGAGGAK